MGSLVGSRCHSWRISSFWRLSFIARYWRWSSCSTALLFAKEARSSEESGGGGAIAEGKGGRADVRTLRLDGDVLGEGKGRCRDARLTEVAAALKRNDAGTVSGKGEIPPPSVNEGRLYS
jgi:hypothetical protein